MKNFKRLFSLLTLVIMATLAMCISFGCGGGNDNQNTWDKRTYEVQVVLADGTTPVKDIRLALCYNTETSSTCLNPVKTDANGKATITIPETITFVGNPVLHFYKASDLPEGYGMPSNMTNITMVDNSVYEHALELTQKSTKLILTVAA